MLTQEEYQMLINIFSIADDKIFSQENHYFDTPAFALKQIVQPYGSARKMVNMK
jgi:uncharacterized protein YjbK